MSGITGVLYLILLMMKLFWEHVKGTHPGSGKLLGAQVKTEAFLLGCSWWCYHI